MDAVSPLAAALFEAAVEHVNKQNYSSKQKTKLNGLFKHITIGKCSAKKPNLLSFGAAARHEAWKACENLTVEEAVNQYIRFVEEIDPTFDSKKIKIPEKQDKMDAELNGLPPALPPHLRKHFGGSSKNRSSPDFVQEVLKQSGFDPVNEDFDDDARIALHEKLVKYYRAVDPDRLVSGIGEIVDYGVKHGVEKLNSVLLKKYGVDLTEMEEKEKRRWSGVNHQISAETPLDGIRREKFTTLTTNEAVELSRKIEQFFTLFDPEKLAIGKETGFIDLVRYIDKRGARALNSKLNKKYGKSLDNIALSEASESEGDTRKKSSRGVPGDSFSDLRSTIKVSVKSGRVNDIELPEYVKAGLVAFYARYEQERLRDGSVKKIYSWAKRNGLRKLNKELRKRYKQSLDEFLEAADELKAELVAFYRHIDGDKVQENLDKIHNWGVKNGRRALNQKLNSKYGVDLDSYKTGAVVQTSSELNF